MKRLMMIVIIISAIGFVALKEVNSTVGAIEKRINIINSVK